MARWGIAWPRRSPQDYQLASSPSPASQPHYHDLHLDLLCADKEVDRLEHDLFDITEKLKAADLRREAKWKVVRCQQEQQAAEVEERSARS
jgi:hypothetical protein